VKRPPATRPTGPARRERRERDPEAAAVVALGRRRATLGKAVLAVGSVCAFVLAAALARAGEAGHSRHPTRQLAAPPAFVAAVRRDLLDAGVVAPPQGPPTSATTVS
jgi:hypothetical protein